jgi:hypothetical protein
MCPPGVAFAQRMARLLALICAASIDFGCFEDTSDASPDTAESAEAGAPGLVSCVDDPRIDRNVAHLTKSGDLGVLFFEIVESDPDPPLKGHNRFLVKVTDANAMPIKDGLDVALTMPDHGHDASTLPLVQLDSQAGTYSVEPLDFFMAGVWSVEFVVPSRESAVPRDRVEFFFCVEG